MTDTIGAVNESRESEKPTRSRVGWWRQLGGQGQGAAVAATACAAALLGYAGVSLLAADATRDAETASVAAGIAARTLATSEALGCDTGADLASARRCAAAFPAADASTPQTLGDLTTTGSLAGRPYTASLTVTPDQACPTQPQIVAAAIVNRSVSVHLDDTDDTDGTAAVFTETIPTRYALLVPTDDDQVTAVGAGDVTLIRTAAHGCAAFPLDARATLRVAGHDYTAPVPDPALAAQDVP